MNYRRNREAHSGRGAEAEGRWKMRTRATIQVQVDVSHDNVFDLKKALAALRAEGPFQASVAGSANARSYSYAVRPLKKARVVKLERKR
jgi:hypothetical protein